MIHFFLSSELACLKQNIFDLQNRFYHPVDRELLEFCAANKYQLCCVQQKLYGELKHVVFNNYTALAITEAVPLEQLYVVIDLLSGEIIEFNGMRHFHDADILIRMRPDNPELGDFFDLNDFMSYLKVVNTNNNNTSDPFNESKDTENNDSNISSDLPF